jgi:hypothetical protein
MMVSQIKESYYVGFPLTEGVLHHRRQPYFYNLFDFLVNIPGLCISITQLLEQCYRKIPEKKLADIVAGKEIRFLPNYVVNLLKKIYNCVTLEILICGYWLLI